MDTIQYLLKHIVRIAVGIVLLIFLFWLGKIVTPLLSQEFIPRKNMTLSRGASSTEFFLPTPMDYNKGGVKTPSATDNVYVFKPAIGLDGSQITTYGKANPQGTWQPTPDGQYIFVQNTQQENNNISGSQVFDSTKAGFSSMSAYLRGVTLPVGAYVYRGLVFYGQAREVMFIDGKFSLYIIDEHGNVIGQGQAVTGTTWQTPGWHPFTATITTTIPKALGCGLVIQQDKIQGLHATMPVSCR